MLYQIKDLICNSYHFITSHASKVQMNKIKPFHYLIHFLLFTYYCTYLFVVLYYTICEKKNKFLRLMRFKIMTFYSVKPIPPCFLIHMHLLPAFTCLSCICLCTCTSTRSFFLCSKAAKTALPLQSNLLFYMVHHHTVSLLLYT